MNLTYKSDVFTIEVDLKVTVPSCTLAFYFIVLQISFFIANGDIEMHSDGDFYAASTVRTTAVLVPLRRENNSGK
jgi:hypothetical protein